MTKLLIALTLFSAYASAKQDSELFCRTTLQTGRHLMLFLKRQNPEAGNYDSLLFAEDENANNSYDRGEELFRASPRARLRLQFTMDQESQSYSAVTSRNDAAILVRFREQAPGSTLSAWIRFRVMDREGNRISRWDQEVPMNCSLR